MTIYERTLTEMCGGAERFRLLRTLYEQPNREFHLRGLAAAARVDPSNTSKLLTRLVQTGLCERLESQPYSKYRGNFSNPLFPELVALFSKASSVFEELANASKSIDGVVVVFGSTAKNQDQTGSDIDLLVITNEPATRVAAPLYAVGDKFGRKTQVLVRSEQEIVEELRNGSGIWQEIFSGPLIKIKGEVPSEINRGISEEWKQGVPPSRHRSSSRRDSHPSRRRLGQDR